MVSPYPTSALTWVRYWFSRVTRINAAVASGLLSPRRPSVTMDGTPVQWRYESGRPMTTAPMIRATRKSPSTIVHRNMNHTRVLLPGITTLVIRQYTAAMEVYSVSNRIWTGDMWHGRWHTKTIYTNIYPGGFALIDLISATNVTTRPRIATKDIVSSTRVIRSVVSSLDMFNYYRIGWEICMYRIVRDTPALLIYTPKLDQQSV